jgi:hypothetical protein
MTWTNPARFRLMQWSHNPKTHTNNLLGSVGLIALLLLIRFAFRLLPTTTRKQRRQRSLPYSSLGSLYTRQATKHPLRRFPIVGWHRRRIERPSPRTPSAPFRNF